jgi:tetratricopeptide (TPR) repeat protein
VVKLGPAFAILVSIMGRAAFASDDERARALFEEGVRAASEERWEDALQAFRASRDLAPRASTEFNIGSTLLKLGRHEEAIRSLEAYLATPDARSDVTLRAEAERMIAEARALMVPPPQPPPPPATPHPLLEPPRQVPPPAESPEQEASFVPWIIVGAAVAVVGAAIGIGFAVNAGERAPYGGTADTVLMALERRE